VPERSQQESQMRKQANRSRGGEALPGSSFLKADIGLCSLTKAPVPSTSSTHTRTPMPFRRARCAHLMSCGNGIGVQMPRARAGNGYLFVTMSSNDPSLRKMVAAMSTIARFVLDVRENCLPGGRSQQAHHSPEAHMLRQLPGNCDTARTMLLPISPAKAPIPMPSIDAD
jgi:hypothetical protein